MVINLIIIILPFSHFSNVGDIRFSYILWVIIGEHNPVLLRVFKQHKQCSLNITVLNVSGLAGVSLSEDSLFFRYIDRVRRGTSYYLAITFCQLQHEFATYCQYILVYFC